MFCYPVLQLSCQEYVTMCYQSFLWTESQTQILLKLHMRDHQAVVSLDEKSFMVE